MKQFTKIAVVCALAVSLAACGSSNSMIELTPAELEKYSKPDGWVDICKPIG